MDVVLNESAAIYGVWNKDIPYYALGDVTFPMDYVSSRLFFTMASMGH